MKQPDGLQSLKRNKDLIADVKSRMGSLDARRDPIKKKFAFIEGAQQDFTVEFSEDDKAKLAGLDESW